jgi:hypothetical protein
MYKDRWNNDPGYFTAGKKPPGAANYFSKAWNSYNDEDYLNQGDQSGLIAKMRNVVIEKSKDFQAGFDADESVQYDASTLKKDPQMPKAETFDGVGKAKVLTSEEQVEDAEADEEVAAAAENLSEYAMAQQRLQFEVESYYKEGTEPKAPSERTGNPRGGSEKKDDEEEKPKKKGKAMVLKRAGGKKEVVSVRGGVEQTVKAPAKGSKNDEGSTTGVPEGAASKQGTATRGRPTGSLLPSAAEQFGLSAGDANTLTSAQRSLLNMVAENRATDSRGKGWDKGDLAYSLAFWEGQEGYEKTAEQHKLILSSIFVAEKLGGDITELKEIHALSTGRFVSLSKEGRAFIVNDVLRNKEGTPDYASLSDYDIKTLLNIMDEESKRPPPVAEAEKTLRRKTRPLMEAEPDATAKARKEELAEDIKSRAVQSPGAARAKKTPKKYGE